MDLVWGAPLAAVATDVGLTANGLAKLCDRLAIPRPGRNYWHLPPDERARHRPALPAAPLDAGETVLLGGPRQNRRSRTRLTIEERREQLLDAAARVATMEGVNEVSLNRIAREVDISEAQAHNCFGKRIDLLIALTRRELAAIEQTRRGVISRGDDPVTSVVLSTIFYLEEAETRGPLLQALLRVREIKMALSEERAELRRQARAPVLASMRARYGMSEAEAEGANAILSAIALRAGAMLATRRIDHGVATRLSLAIILAGMRSNAGGSLLATPAEALLNPADRSPVAAPARRSRRPSADH
ncbi:TetR/AcrR family transcriptional regulator [Niveispirillum fermenti]|uniref:TetR/AcrR family transcriptional regulator n=1 Tax=Niveispirillum fermenti TaxID=1233113 RepID=UPI003A839CD7